MKDSQKLGIIAIIISVVLPLGIFRYQELVKPSQLTGEKLEESLNKLKESEINSQIICNI